MVPQLNVIADHVVMCRLQIKYRSVRMQTFSTQLGMYFSAAFHEYRSICIVCTVWSNIGIFKFAAVFP